MVSSYPGNRSLKESVAGALRRYFNEKRMRDARTEIEAMDLNGRSGYSRRIDNSYGDESVILDILDEARKASVSEREAREAAEKAQSEIQAKHVEAARKLVGTGNGFFIRVNLDVYGQQWLPVDGEKVSVKGFPQIELFAHADLNPTNGQVFGDVPLEVTQYAVSEATTGLVLARGKTAVSAERAAKKTLGDMGLAKTLETIDKNYEINGRSPWKRPEEQNAETENTG